MTDFFISYTSKDRQWAEWIGFVLEEERYTVKLQAWDFRPGSNFVVEMQDAAAKAARTIMVLSPDYLKSLFAKPEWAAAFAKDPQGLEKRLVPVIVRPCEPDGLLGQIVHISLVDLDAGAARQELLAGIRSERSKPAKAPAFPGKTAPAAAFPGSGTSAGAGAIGAYLPKVRRAASDVEKRRFLKSAFTTIRDYFESALPQLGRQISGLEFEFQPVTALEFTAEIFIGGKSMTSCRIWHGGGDAFSRDGISYAEGRHNSPGTINESLSISERTGELTLSPMMEGFGYSSNKPAFDTKNMTPSQAAEYLWRRFVARLESR